MFKRLFVLLTLLILTFCVVVGNTASSPGQPPVEVIPRIDYMEVEAEVNAVRVQSGLNSLPNNSQLSESATQRAAFLCDNNSWTHDGWADGIIYVYRKAGENLEYGSKRQTARTIVDAWVKSPTHYANMLDPAFTEQGMGVKYCDFYQGQSEVVIVVNHFGVPK